MNWKIKCYVSRSGRCEVQSRYDKGSEGLKAGFDTALEYLTPRGRDQWTRPHAAKLSKNQKFRDFFEIRFLSDKVQQRPIGFFGPGEDEFTIVIWAIEKGSRFNPEDWFDIANNRRKEILDGTATVQCFKAEGDEDECQET